MSTDTLVIVDWNESIYCQDDKLIDTISCSEMFTSQQSADAFIASLDKSVCSNISSS